jgi:hypothetical protein
MILTYSAERTQWKDVESTSTGLLHLPVELLIEALKYLWFQDILRCQAVCQVYLALLAFVH